MRVVVVADEQHARAELCFQLEQLGDVEIIGEAGNGLEAMAAVDRLDPDLVFLDVQMPGLDGFEVARRLLDRGEEAPGFIFVTAYDQHAIAAFEGNPVAYLLKPVEAGRLEQALQRARKRLGNDRPGAGAPLNDQLERIVRLMADREV